MEKKKSIIFIGGTGASIVVKQAKKNKSWEICFLVSLVDDGGSTGKLRREFGIPPVGDIRKAFVSLSKLNQEFLDLFEYRFPKGELKSHTIGNLLLASFFLKGKEKNRELNETLRIIEKNLHTQGHVIPSTLENLELNTQFENGAIIRGEDNLDENKDTTFGKPIKYFFTKDAPANPLAIKAIKKAKAIVLGPGDLGANTIAPILPAPIRKTLQKTQAKLIYIANLMTKNGETDQFTVNDCLQFIEKTIQKKINYVLVNNAKIPDNILNIYQNQKEYPMKILKEKLDKRTKLINSDLLSETVYQKLPTDFLRRSLLRHDGKKVVHLLKKII